MIDPIHAFEAKLEVCRNDIHTKNYNYFPNLKKIIKHLDYMKPDKEKILKELISVINSSIQEFSAKFCQFNEASETFKFIMYRVRISTNNMTCSLSNLEVTVFSKILYRAKRYIKLQQLLILYYAQIKAQTKYYSLICVMHQYIV